MAHTFEDRTMIAAHFGASLVKAITHQRHKRGQAKFLFL
jgi:hypothetical protein